MTSPRVSIPLPVYNGAATIGAAVESALAQTFEDFELIVCDNASTDGTLDVVAGFDDPRIRVIRWPENVGFLPNHNRGMAEARGEFVKPLHADDRLLPTCLEAMLEVFDRHPEVGLVFAPRQVELEDEADPEMLEWRELFGRPHLNFDRLSEANDGLHLLRQYLRGLADGRAENWIGEPTAVMVRRSVLERIGLYSPRVMAMNDMDMNMRALALFDVGFVEEPQSVYVRSRGSLVDSLNPLDWLDRLWMLQGLAEEPDIHRRIPEVDAVLATERRRVGRLLLRTARRQPGLLPQRLRQFGRYGRHVAQVRAGSAVATHPRPPARA